MARDMTDSSPLRRPLRLTRSQAKLNTSDDDGADCPTTGSGDSPFNLKLASDTFLLDGNDSFDAQMAAAINDSPLKASRRAPSPKKTIGKPKFAFRQPSSQSSTSAVEVGPAPAPVSNQSQHITHERVDNENATERKDTNHNSESIPVAESGRSTLPEGRGRRRKTSSVIHPLDTARAEEAELLHAPVQHERPVHRTSILASAHESQQKTAAPQPPNAVSQATQPQRRVIRLRRNEAPQILEPAASATDAIESSQKASVPPPPVVPQRSLKQHPSSAITQVAQEGTPERLADTSLAPPQDVILVCSPEDAGPIVEKVVFQSELPEDEAGGPAVSPVYLQDENTQTAEDIQADGEQVQEVVPPPRVAAHVPKRMRVVSAATKPTTLKRTHAATEDRAAAKENAPKASVPVKRPKLAPPPPTKTQVKSVERVRPSTTAAVAPRGRVISALRMEAKKPARAVKSALPEEARRAPLRERSHAQVAPVVPEKLVKKATVPHAFTFESDRRLELHKEHPAHKENRPTPKPVIVFKPAHHPANVARPTESSIAHAIAQLTAPKPKLASKQSHSHLVSGFKPTVPQAPNFATDVRMKEREAFDELIRVKEEDKRIAEERRRDEDAQRAEDEVKELRRLMDEHAKANVHPVPHWYEERRELLEAKKA